MVKECKKCGELFEIHQEIDGKARNLKKRIYCLNCSPFGSNNNKNLENAIKYGYNHETHKLCTRCDTVKELSEENYYKRKDRKGNGFHHFCKKCLSNISADNQKALKSWAVEYMGGKCVHCGYNKCIAAMEFHHLDPSEKDYEPARLFGQNQPREIIKRELDKCLLLCANCHREEHYRLKFGDEIRVETRKRLEKINVGALSKEYSFPENDILQDMINNNGISDVAKQISVSFDALRSHIKLIGLEVNQMRMTEKRRQNFKSKEKISWPPDEELAEIVWKFSMTELSRKFGVSDNAIRKRCRIRNIQFPKKKSG